MDIETDGLDINKNKIIEIGAVKVGKVREEFQRLIKIQGKLPEEIIKLTKIEDEILEKEGVFICDALKEFLDFIGEKNLVGYNVNFDMKFLNEALEKENLPKIKNKVYDILQYVKKENLFLKNYKLNTALKSYGIDEEVPHRALEDARLEEKLILKVKKLLASLK